MSGVSGDNVVRFPGGGDAKQLAASRARGFIAAQKDDLALVRVERLDGVEVWVVALVTAVDAGGQVTHIHADDDGPVDLRRLTVRWEFMVIPRRWMTAGVVMLIRAQFADLAAAKAALTLFKIPGADT